MYHLLKKKRKKKNHKEKNSLLQKLISNYTQKVFQYVKNWQARVKEMCLKRHQTNKSNWVSHHIQNPVTSDSVEMWIVTVCNAKLYLMCFYFKLENQ